jgi:hypothetical protein
LRYRFPFFFGALFPAARFVRATAAFALDSSSVKNPDFRLD